MNTHSTHDIAKYRTSVPCYLHRATVVLRLRPISVSMEAKRWGREGELFPCCCRLVFRLGTCRYLRTVGW
jgi:hypothetical protein